MKECISCKESMRQCMDTHTFAFAHLYNDEKAMDMHIHDCYEIYYSISGGKQFLIDNYFYDISDGVLYLIKHFESHYLTQIDQQKHERIILSIDPEYLKQISTEKTDLNHCFQFRGTDMPHQLHLSAEEQTRFIYFIHKLRSNSGFGEDVLDRATFLELMVFLNNAFDKRCRSSAEEEPKTPGYHAQVDPIRLGYHIIAFINLDVTPEDKPKFYAYAESIPNVLECNCVTGDYSMLLKVAFQSTMELDIFIGQLQKFGKTSTQIVFSTHVGPRGVDVEE